MIARIAAAITLAAQLAACTSLQPLPSTGGPPYQALHAGDEVRIVTRDGKAHEFKVTGAPEGSVCGAGQCIGVSDIASIDRRDIDGGRTALLIVGILLLVVLGVAAGSPPIGAY